MLWCYGFRGPVHGWLGLVRLGAQNGITTCPQERGGGGWRKLVMEVGEGLCYASGSRVPAVACHTECRDPMLLISSISLSTVSHPSSFSVSCSLHDIPSIWSSACRHHRLYKRWATCCHILPLYKGEAKLSGIQAILHWLLEPESVEERPGSRTTI